MSAPVAYGGAAIGGDTITLGDPRIGTRILTTLWTPYGETGMQMKEPRTMSTFTSCTVDHFHAIYLGPVQFSRRHDLAEPSCPTTCPARLS
ncbi:hypothetical protein ORI20_16010 [Mycobacterium sp. CVI_P3]|uniref:Uncharacterized protein n=1 Tax=Mycobacterium pinniadriaticum TaxID=2994102 RepID=A0ABT3SF66_9MYCO|nr:hypothetical protein [Mycobacterium pinniadriaticum]MCX2931787.1 hypothetical protein [Mycobacterium pinniadriaticum]MCX2938138.1 hypothetical protein [Mycobacterium pinniadriaticum]